jgi:NAD(P)-dependent dehydrogenase (short-subunit alcohol dehydrogenase family)
MQGVFAGAAGEFRGRVAVVTGGSDGLGKDLVCRLIALGCRVFFCGRDPRKGAAVARKLGKTATFIQSDLGDPEQACAFIAEVRARASAIDYLVNNAAIDPRIEFRTATVAEFDRLIAINLRSYFVVAQAALPALEKGKGKAVLNICTTNYMLGLAPFTVYNAAKSGIIGFTRSLARELGPVGIRVNALSPGWIMTAKQLREHVQERDKRELLEAQCLKRLMVPADVTPAMLFLLSSAARGITGQNLVVDGGKVMGN